MNFLWHAAFCDHTVWSAHPFPTLQECRAQQLKTRPECWIRGLQEATTQGIEATSANLFRKERLGMQRSSKAMLLRPTSLGTRLSPPIYDFGWQAVTHGDRPRIGRSNAKANTRGHQLSRIITSSDVDGDCDIQAP
jgi:hypothetical protein